LEKWLENIISECKREAEKSLGELKKQGPRLSMNIELGKEKYGFGIDLSNMIEKFAVPTQLLLRGFNGIKNTVDCLGMPVKTDYKIKGHSDTEYAIPYFLESKDRQILIEPLYFSGFMQAFGMDDFEYSAFFPYFALDFFKYVDIMNAQKKPTIMAFIGLTDFQDIAEVDFLDFIKNQLKNSSIATSEKEEVPRKAEGTYPFKIVPENMFKAYGIPRFQTHLIDALRISTYNPKKVSERTKIRAYATSLGTFGFLNPTIVDYTLFTTHMSGKTDPEAIGEILKKGKDLGHLPSKSKLLPEFDSAVAMENPLALMKELRKLGMVTEIRGKYKMANKGFRIFEAEVFGKPKEWSLSKVWNMVKKAKDVLPFLRFLSKD
jgi:uncharacterized protein YfkK (UPF0435 family)